MNNNKYSLREELVGFTLVEILIALAIIGLIIPTTASVLFTLFRQQRAVAQLAQLKREGDGIRSYLRDFIRQSSYRIASYNATGQPTFYCLPPSNLTEYNTSSGLNFYFVRQDGSAFRFFADDNLLMQNRRGSNTNTPIHGNSVEITNFSIGCFVPSRYSSPVIYASFTVRPRQVIAGIIRREIIYSFMYKLSVY